MNMQIIQDTPQTILFKGPNYNNLHEGFSVLGLYYTLTFSAALVTSNTINGKVGTQDIDQVTFATDNDNTMQLIAAKIAAKPGVKKVEVVLVTGAATNDRVINVFPSDQTNGINLSGWAVTNGGSQATVAVAMVDSRIKTGMPVELVSTEDHMIKPATAASLQTTCIGFAIADEEYPNEVTVSMKARAIIMAECNADIVPGPVKWVSYNTSTGYNKVDDDTVAAATQFGWALEAGAAGSVIQVAVK